LNTYINELYAGSIDQCISIALKERNTWLLAKISSRLLHARVLAQRDNIQVRDQHANEFVAIIMYLAHTRKLIFEYSGERLFASHPSPYMIYFAGMPRISVKEYKEHMDRHWLLIERDEKGLKTLGMLIQYARCLISGIDIQVEKLEQCARDLDAGIVMCKL